ncbi:MAG: peptide-methionine (S)-S-oxide reductase MsrA [bacterium]|nr:peptide-methionine (S)-S-oxide reductase MsrA [bacterium]
MPEIKTENLEKAIFAAGCFWRVEEAFIHLKGVRKTAVGYTGGTLENPTYETVSSGRTGHAESVEITYDPKIISYEEFLKVFWENHDPTTPNRQGPDVGSQYRSAIFYKNSGQKTLAERSKMALEKSRKFQNKIVTEIAPASTFWSAEEYHQQYLHKRGLNTCPA